MPLLVWMTIPTTHYDVVAWLEAKNVIEAIYRDIEGFPQRMPSG